MRECPAMRDPAEVCLARAARTTVDGLGRDQNCRQVGLGATSMEADGTMVSNKRSLTVAGKAEEYIRDENKRRPKGGSKVWEGAARSAA